MPGPLTDDELQAVTQVIGMHTAGERTKWCNEVLGYLGQFKWAGSTAVWAQDDTTDLAMNCWCAPIYIAYKQGRLKKKTVDDFSMLSFQYQLSPLAASQRAAYEFLKGSLAGGDEGVPGDLMFFFIDSLAGVYGKDSPLTTSVPLDKCPVHVAVNMGPGKCVSLWSTPNDYDKYQYCDVRALVQAIERDRKAKCSITSIEPFWIVGAKKKSRCYLTTASCESRGLPDDCDELTTLRRFRDLIVLSTPEGARQVAEYYATAPMIVQRIDSRDDARAVYDRIYQAYIAPSVQAVQARQFDRAHGLFQTMVRELAEEFDVASVVARERPFPENGAYRG